MSVDIYMSYRCMMLLLLVLKIAVFACVQGRDRDNRKLLNPVPENINSAVQGCKDDVVTCNPTSRDGDVTSASAHGRSCSDSGGLRQNSLQPTGWLKLKYRTGQNAISRQPCEILYPNFLVYIGEILVNSEI